MCSLPASAKCRPLAVRISCQKSGSAPIVGGASAVACTRCLRAFAIRRAGWSRFYGVVMHRIRAGRIRRGQGRVRTCRALGFVEDRVRPRAADVLSFLPEPALVAHAYPGHGDGEETYERARDETTYEVGMTGHIWLAETIGNASSENANRGLNGWLGLNMVSVASQFVHGAKAYLDAAKTS